MIPLLTNELELFFHPSFSNCVCVCVCEGAPVWMGVYERKYTFRLLSCIILDHCFIFPIEAGLLIPS